MNWFALTLGGALLGVAAWLLLQEENSLAIGSRVGRPPVEKLADQLQHAWAEPHNTSV